MTKPLHLEIAGRVASKKKVAFYRLLRKLKRSPKAVQISLFDDM